MNKRERPSVRINTRLAGIYIILCEGAAQFPHDLPHKIDLYPGWQYKYLSNC